MNRLKTVGIYLVVALFVGFTACSFDVLAGQKSPDQKAEQELLSSKVSLTSSFTTT